MIGITTTAAGWMAFLIARPDFHAWAETEAEAVCKLCRKLHLLMYTTPEEAAKIHEFSRR